MLPIILARWIAGVALATFARSLPEAFTRAARWADHAPANVDAAARPRLDLREPVVVCNEDHRFIAARANATAPG
jgi:hypothetical protein